MTVKKTTTRKSTARKASVPASRANAGVRPLRMRQKIIRSNLNKDSIKVSSDPFAMGNVVGNQSLQVNFASEQGRRGSEIVGLNTGPKTTSIINSVVARKRSRYAVLTNPYAKRGIDILVSNVVGTGHTMVSDAPDPVFKKQVEDLWNEWIENIDTTGKLSFGNCESLAFRSMVEGGDCFIRLRVRRPEDGLVVPLQIQLFEAEQVPVFKNEISGANQIIAGIEFNPLGVPAFYHMYRNHPGDTFLPSSVDPLQNGMQTTSVPAEDIIHLHDVRRPNEVRGLPVLSQSLIQLSDLDKYLDAELVRKKACALIGGFIRQPADGVDTNPFVTDENGEEDSDSDVHIETMEPGSFPILPPGYEVTFSNPVDVGQNFSVFLRQQLMMCASALNITYEQLSGDPSQGNDRTIRATMLEFKRIAEQYQKNIMVHQFCRVIFNKWFDLALLSGALVIPKGLDAKQARKVQWVADPWDYLNPQQELNTQIQETRAGFVPWTTQLIKRGLNPEAVKNQFILDKKIWEENNLVFVTDPGSVSNAGVAHSTDPTLEGTAPRPPNNSGGNDAPSFGS